MELKKDVLNFILMMYYINSIPNIFGATFTEKDDTILPYYNRQERVYHACK